MTPPPEELTPQRLVPVARQVRSAVTVARDGRHS
jgi:hypothetical protein